MGKTGRNLVAVLRALGSLLPTGPRRRPVSDRVVRWWRQDSQHSYPSVGLTPSRLLAYLQAADAGAPQAQFELFAEMLQKWPRLAAVENTRRLALTGLDWEIAVGPQAAGGGVGREVAQRAADFCRSTLDRLDGFRQALSHLANAIGYGIAVVELVWEVGKLVDLVPVPYGRLISDPQEPWRLRILTEEEPARGVALDEHPFKWVVHQPRAMPGRRPPAGGLGAGRSVQDGEETMAMAYGTYSSAQTNMELVPAQPGKIIRVVRLLFTTWGSLKVMLVSDPGPDPVVLLPFTHVSAGTGLHLHLGRAGALTTGRGKALGFSSAYQVTASEYSITLWYEVVE